MKAPSAPLKECDSQAKATDCADKVTSASARSAFHDDDPRVDSRMTLTMSAEVTDPAHMSKDSEDGDNVHHPDVPPEPPDATDITEVDGGAERVEMVEAKTSGTGAEGKYGDDGPYRRSGRARW